ncbi:MAG: RNA polymerase sigma-70 factor (ECF subfamily) [Planctomycetota bacterium]|jgi:RNA polymerase sigma-70 factor (ECF subfamily)
MDRAPSLPLTEYLSDARNGNATAVASVLAIAYEELGRLAQGHLRQERANHTLQPTALVHEAWMKLGADIAKVENRTHFFAIASQAMRRVLTDHARGRNRLKRAGKQLRVTLDESVAAPSNHGFDYVELDDVLTRLTQLNSRHARVVELRVFGGLTIAEAASVLDVSHTTIEKDWAFARAWLRTALAQD